jgi:hypothetical protein
MSLMNLIRRAIALTAAAAMASLVALTVGACSGATTARGAPVYRAHGVSFDYPAGWRLEEKLPASAASGWLWGTKFGPGPGADVISIAAFRLRIPVGVGNLAEADVQLEPTLRRFFAQERGAMKAGPQQITVGGLPGLRFQGTGTQHDGTVVGNTLLFVFDGTTEYGIECQYTRADAGEMERACGQVMRTFKVSKAT